MRVSDRVLKMDKGNEAAYPEYKKRYPGSSVEAGSSALGGYLPVYSKDSKDIGHLPVVADYDENFPWYNIKDNKFGASKDVCVGNPDSSQCMYTSSRGLYNMYGPDVFGDINSYLNETMRIDTGSVTDWFAKNGMSNDLKAWREKTKGEDADWKKWGYFMKSPKNDIYGTGAWYLKDIMLKNKGKVIWSRKDWRKDANGLTRGNMKDVYSKLRVGDIVTMRRKTGMDPYAKNYRLPNYTHEAGVTHSGIIIGASEDGFPLILHAWAGPAGDGVEDGRVKIEKINKLSNYRVSSIIRHGKITGKDDDPVTVPDAIADNSGEKAQENVIPEDSFPDRWVLPKNYDKISSFFDYLKDEDLKKENIPRRMNYTTKETREGTKYSVFDISDLDIDSWEGVNVWSKKAAIKRYQDEARKKRKGRMFKAIFGGKKGKEEIREAKTAKFKGEYLANLKYRSGGKIGLLLRY